MSPFIKDASVQAVAEAASLVDVAGQYTTLRKRGVTYVGLCPFHQEKTPSFTVSAEKNVFYCFGCGEGGDVFTFLEKMENLSFAEAVEMLAERYGIALEYERTAGQEAPGRDLEKRLLLLLERTCTFYQRFLWDSAEGARARAYLESRGLARPTLEEFRVGYSPSGRRALVDRARKGGFTERELEAAGLAVVQIGQPYDRFRGRLMFPLQDHRGRVVGFGGRTLAGEEPKYLNSPEGQLYHKGSLLYGLYQARKAIADEDEALVVEGYTDVIAVVQSGIRNVVASMGTALTERQLMLLSRYTRNITFMFDADRAGAEAALRSGRVARQLELRSAVVTLPGGLDPADIVRERSPAALVELVGAKMPLLRYEITRVLDRFDIARPEGRVAAFEHIARLLETADSQKEREEEVQAVAHRLQLTPESVALLLQGGKSPKGAEASYEARVAAPGYVLERRVLVGMIAFPDTAEEFIRALSPEHFSGADHREVFQALTEERAKGLPLDQGARRLAASGGSLGGLLAGLLVEGEEEVYSRALLQHDYLRLHEQHVGRAAAALRRQLERGDIDEEAERRLYRLELLQQEIRQALAGIEEEQTP